MEYIIYEKTETNTIHRIIEDTKRVLKHPIGIDDYDGSITNNILSAFEEPA